MHLLIIHKVLSLKLIVGFYIILFENLVCLKNSQTISSQITGLPYTWIFKEVLWFIGDFPVLQYSTQLIPKEDMGRGPMCNGNATQFLEVG